MTQNVGRVGRSSFIFAGCLVLSGVDENGFETNLHYITHHVYDLREHKAETKLQWLRFISYWPL